jgi:AraC-like DNA-binding protein
MARKAGMSRTLFAANFKKYAGMSLIEFTTNTRINTAMQLLGETGKSITEIVYESGFNNIGHQ